MTYCTQCGAARAATARFCAECGAAVETAAPTSTTPPPAAATAPAAPTTTRVLPPAAEPGARPAAAPTTVDWRRLLGGNWLGAAVVAVLAAAATGLMGLLLALLAKPADFGIDNTLTLATAVATGAFGADLRAEGGENGDSLFNVEGSGTLGAVPLTVTILALAVALLLFRRMTRHQTSGAAALGDAVRTSLLFGVVMWVAALVFRSDNDELGRGWVADLDARSSGVDASIGADPVGALFLPMLVLVVVLGLAVLREDWWTGRLAQVRGWVAAPIAGLASLVVLLPVAGAIGYAAIAVAGESNDPVDYTSDDWGAFAASLVGYAGNAGFWLLGLGAGAPLGTEGTVSGEGTTASWERLWGEITETEPGLWVAPFVLLAVLVVATLAVLRRTPPAAADALPVLGAWLGSLVVALPVLSRVSSVHAALDAESGDESFTASGYVGPDGLQTTLLVLLVALVVTVVLALMTGRLDPTATRAGVSRAVRAASTAAAPPAASAPHDVPPPPAGHPVDRLDSHSGQDLT